MSRGEEGFTLIEIIIFIAFISIILSALFVIFINGQDALNFSKERIEFQRVHRLLIAWISRYTRKAILIDDNPSGYDALQIKYKEEDNEEKIAFGLDDSGYFYYRKKISGSWGNARRIGDLQGNNLSFSYSGNILTVNATLLNGNKHYSFANKFFPRYSFVTTP